MIDDKTQKDILKTILTSGSAGEVKVNHILNGNLNHVLNLSSGAARIQYNVVGRFKLILSQPERLSFLNPFEIHCILCHKVIKYPCWYYSNHYAVNHFHYFVCFDKPNGVTANCYKRSI